MAVDAKLPTFTVHRGTYTEIADYIKELHAKHWEETGIASCNLPLDIDLDVYKSLEDKGLHLALGIKADGEPAGYLSVVIYEHHQHKGHMFAMTDGFFLDKKYRSLRSFKAVIKMFERAETILRDEFDVEYLYLGTNAQNDLKFLAECLKFKPDAVMYIKRLK